MKLTVLKGMNLNTEMYRGYAPLADLARVSKADTFNQDSNKEGLQRDLSEKHSRDAYDFVREMESKPEHARAWAEVLLNVRDTSVIKKTVVNEDIGLYELEIFEDRLNSAHPYPQISRTDGNHRLNFAAGSARLAPLTASTPFSMTIGLERGAEAYLFMDINENQKTMNTSHLAHLKEKLTEEEELIRDDPALWIANKLADDVKSPWCGRVHKGSARTQGNKRRVNLAALRSGVNMTLRDTVKLRSVDSIDAKYGFIRMFWNAVARSFSEDWRNDNSMLLKGIGIWTFSHVGAEIIDRCLVRGIAPSALDNEMDAYLRQTKMIFDWESTSSMKDYGGQTGAMRAATKMKAALSDEDVNIGIIADAVRNMG